MFIQKATGNATETVVSLSEYTGLNTFVHTEKTKRKREHNRLCSCYGAFIQKATGNGNATEIVVPLSEQMGFNVFVQTEETRRKRQRN